MHTIDTFLFAMYWLALERTPYSAEVNSGTGENLPPPSEQSSWAKWGGIAALFEASAYLFGFLMMALVFASAGDAASSAQDRLEHLLQHQELYQLWMMVIYVFFGIALVPLVAALERQLPTTVHPLKQCSTLFGYVWVVLVIASGMIGQVGLAAAGRLYDTNTHTASTVWATIEAVQDGLGGSVEIVGGLWVLLVSLLAYREEKLTTFINSTGLVVGIAGVLTVLPGLTFLGAVFGLLQIIWFSSLGIHLIRLHHERTS